jgi:putative acetyltransferase
MTTHVRAETAADAARVYEIERAAFGGTFEPDLVDTLRRDAAPVISLVAEREGTLVGHVFFSPVAVESSPVETQGEPGAFGALAPLAVDPPLQGQGVGSLLVREGLEACRALGWQAVFLVGDPRYYGRFGFELAGPRGLRYGDPHFDAALQVIELLPGALEGREGLVRYHTAFGQPPSP